MDIGSVATFALSIYGAALATFVAFRNNKRSLYVHAGCVSPFDTVIIQIFNPSSRPVKLRSASIHFGKSIGSSKLLLDLESEKGLLLEGGDGKELAVKVSELRSATRKMGIEKTEGGWLWVRFDAFGDMARISQVKVDRSISIKDPSKLALGEGDFNGQLSTAALLGIEMIIKYKVNLYDVMR